VSKIFIPEVPSTGAKHLIRGRNGAMAMGSQQAALANLLNTIAFRRGKVLLSKFTYLGNFPSPSQAFFARFYCSPKVTDVYVAMLLGDSGTPVANTYFWTVDGVVQATRAVQQTLVPSPGPSAYQLQLSRFVDAGGNALAAGVHDVNLQMAGTAAITGCVIFEVASNFGDTAQALAPDVYSVGSPVTGRDLAALHDRAWLLHRQQGTHHIHWTDNAVGKTQLGATYKNILDATTTGYAATAAGFWTIPFRQATLAGTTVPVTMWVYASSDGTTGRVRFVNAAGVIATITGIGAPGYYTATGTLDPTLASDLVIVEHSEATAGKTITTRGAGMYSFDT
jgi:hypothetical protein